MGNIRVLDEHVANLIAAGEVVERPASVVKELVENAIDAGATNIKVQIEEGGLSLIRVTDNGHGIEADDVQTAFHRHATSKVRESRDLGAIRTLGFRGEALPSIASVARVECITSANSSGLGMRFSIAGGGEESREQTRASRGTDIWVRDLFYNTPARLKYMKTVQTEFGHISDYMYRISLAHPHVAFTLVHNDKHVMNTPGTGDLQQTIAAIYGVATARAMLPVTAEDADFTLSGWIGKPELTRANRNGMTTIVNGRYVRSYPLLNAIVQAYHTLLPIGRFPLVVLQLRMDPALVDVNVHPAKLEVRFSKERELTSFVQSELSALLQGHNLIPRMQAKQVKSAVIQERLSFYGAANDRKADDQAAAAIPKHLAGSASSAIQAGQVNERTSHEQATDHRSAYDHKAYDRAAAPNRDADSQRSFRTQSQPAGERLPSRAASRGGAQPNESERNIRFAASAPMARSQPGTQDWQPYLQTSDPGSSQVAERKLPELHVIGQMHGTYILAQNEEGLYLIDQHAAHERINYERFYKKFGEPVQASQELLVPITLEFTAAEYEVLCDKKTMFEQIGVYLEPFGGNTFIVRSVPEWMVKGEERDMLLEMADWVLQDKSLDVAKLREKSAIMSACKASLKANDYLSHEEIASLLKQLGECASPYTCPHGRPIIVSFSTYELEKMFKRVMS